MNYRTTDGLMRHLRENGIAISGGTQKRQLINTGYFHGYKGYRFFVMQEIVCRSRHTARSMQRYDMIRR